VTVNPPQPQQPPYAVTKTNGYAIASLVLGILGLCCCVLGLIGLIFGYIGKGQIERSGGAETGSGLAVAGIVLGWISVAGVIVWILILITTGNP
jgi:hypothetical protein